jgi:hypothetical protein
VAERPGRKIDSGKFICRPMSGVDRQRSSVYHFPCNALTGSSVCRDPNRPRQTDEPEIAFLAQSSFSHALKGHAAR